MTGPGFAGGRMSAHGYTVIELLMSLTVLALGASGVVAMQRVTIESNRYAKNLAIATRVGEAWADQLEADAARWTLNSDISNTTWLKAAGACSQNAGIKAWFQPDWNGDRKFGPAFDALGNPVDTSVTAPDSYTQFCAHVQLAWLHCAVPPTGGGAKGSGIIRAEVRVFWRRDDDRSASAASFQTTGKAALCSASEVEGVNSDINLGAFNAVYFSTAIRQAPE
jgi:prepilin-type N-terminal cleavage/methylation domain-containing protein